MCRSVLASSVAELPTQLWRWIVNKSPDLIYESLPYTAVISRYRGRDLASKLHLYVPEEANKQPTLASDGRSTKFSTASALQLRYPIAQRATQPISLSEYFISSSSSRSLYHKNLFLEDLDTLAADVAGRHVGLHDKALVTAYLHSLDWFEHAYPQSNSTCHYMQTTPQSPGADVLSQAAVPACQPSNVYMTGQVTWVGTSSLEVTIEVTRPISDPTHLPTHAGSGKQPRVNQHELDAVDQEQQQQQVLMARARFIMAARDFSLTKAVAVPRLHVANDREEVLHKQGAVRQHERHSRRKQESSPAAELHVHHDLQQLLHTIKSSSHSDRHGQAAASCTDRTATAMASMQNARGVAMKATLLTQSFLTQFQERNTTGTVFGGQLLRYGAEVGEATAVAHVGGPCHLISMRDAPFLGLVPFGHMMQVTGKVVAVHGSMVAVHVRSQKLSSGATYESEKFIAGQNHTDRTHSTTGRHKQSLTHVYWCVFHAPHASHITPVLPSTLMELKEWQHGLSLCQEAEVQCRQLLHLHDLIDSLC